MRLGVAALIGAALGAPAFLAIDAGDPPVRLTVSPRIALAPSDLHLKIIIERDAGNRALAIVVDGDHYRYDSIRAIEGDQAQRVWDIWLQSLPCGTYAVIIAVVRTDGDERARGSAEFRGPLCPELEAQP